MITINLWVVCLPFPAMDGLWHCFNHIIVNRTLNTMWAPKIAKLVNITPISLWLITIFKGGINHSQSWVVCHIYHTLVKSHEIIIKSLLKLLLITINHETIDFSHWFQPFWSQSIQLMARFVAKHLAEASFVILDEKKHRSHAATGVGLSIYLSIYTLWIQTLPEKIQITPQIIPQTPPKKVLGSIGIYIYIYISVCVCTMMTGSFLDSKCLNWSR